MRGTPENVEYRDEGCEVSPSCLACPLARCKYDVPGGLAEIRRLERDRAIRAMRARGATINEAARRLGVSARSVVRAAHRRV